MCFCNCIISINVWISGKLEIQSMDRRWPSVEMKCGRLCCVSFAHKFNIATASPTLLRDMNEFTQFFPSLLQQLQSHLSPTTHNWSSHVLAEVGPWSPIALYLSTEIQQVQFTPSAGRPPIQHNPAQSQRPPESTKRICSSAYNKLCTYLWKFERLPHLTHASLFLFCPVSTIIISRNIS